MFRRGFSLSSAIGATPSQPVYAKIENTTNGPLIYGQCQPNDPYCGLTLDYKHGVAGPPTGLTGSPTVKLSADSLDFAFL